MHDCHRSPEDGCAACNAWELQLEEDAKRVCPEGVCDGSGLVAKTAYDSDSHAYYPDGEEDCICQDSTDYDPDHAY